MSSPSNIQLPQLQINGSDVVATHLENDGVILNLKTKYYYAANATTMRIWELLEEGRSVADVVGVLCAEYDVDPKRCEQDVMQILEQMRKEQLVTAR